MPTKVLEAVLSLTRKQSRWLMWRMFVAETLLCKCEVDTVGLDVLRLELLARVTVREGNVTLELSQPQGLPE
jgi:hypothetical protein